MDIQQRMKELSDYMRRAQVSISARRGKMLSASELAREAQVSQASFNQWQNGGRIPSADNRYKLADYLYGQLGDLEIYRILEIPVPMPDDPMPRTIASVWGDLPDDAKDSVLQLVKQLQE
jgi:transcriptional regulator with XRE-family HTH domain